MEETRQEPIYWDKHRRPINLTLILSLGMVVFGLFQWLNGNEPTLVFLGLAIAAYTWFTSPKHYVIFPDHLVIMYGTPRRRVIPFRDISHIELLSMPPVGDRLRIVLLNRRGVMLMARDSETFHNRLEEALERFRDTGPMEDTPEERPLNEGQP